MEIILWHQIFLRIWQVWEKIINGDTTFSEIFKLIEVDLELKSLKEAAKNKRNQIPSIPNPTPMVNTNNTEIKNEEINEPPKIILQNTPLDKIENNTVESYFEDDFVKDNDIEVI